MRMRGLRLAILLVSLLAVSLSGLAPANAEVRLSYRDPGDTTLNPCVDQSDPVNCTWTTP